MRRHIWETILSGAVAMLMVPPGVIAFRKAADVISDSLYLSDIVTQTPHILPYGQMLGLALVIAGLLLIILSVAIRKSSEAVMGITWATTGAVVFITPEKISGLDDTLTQTTPYLKILLPVGVALWFLWLVLSVREGDNLLFVLRLLGAAALAGVSIIPALAVAMLVASLLGAMLGMVYAIIFSEGLGNIILGSATIKPEAVPVARIGALTMLAASGFALLATLWDAYLFMTGKYLLPLYLISVYILALALGMMALGTGMMFGGRGAVVGALALTSLMLAIGASFWDRMVAIMLVMLGATLANTIAIKIHEEVLRLKLALGKFYENSETLYWLTMLVLIFTIGTQNPIITKMGENIAYTMPLTTLIGTTIIKLLVLGTITSLVWAVADELRILSAEIGDGV